MKWELVQSSYHASCGGKEAILTFGQNTQKWILGIKFDPRIIPHGIYDLNILWPKKFTPNIEDALAKSDEILEQEWK